MRKQMQDRLPSSSERRRYSVVTERRISEPKSKCIVSSKRILAVPHDRENGIWGCIVKALAKGCGAIKNVIVRLNCVYYCLAFF